MREPKRTRDSAARRLHDGLRNRSRRWETRTAKNRIRIGVLGVCAFCLVFAPVAIANHLGVTGRFVPVTTNGLNLPGNPVLSRLLEGLQRKYSHMQGIAADFLQTYAGSDGRVLRESGRVLLKRPRKARWDYSNPERKIFIADGKNIYFYVYGEREATRSSIKGDVDPQIPFLFLLSSANLNKEFSKIEIVNDQAPAFSGDLMLHLVPKRAPEEFKSLYAEVNTQTMEVRRLIVRQRNGSTMDFLLTNIKENDVAPDRAFSFSPPPGVVIRKAEAQ